MRNFILGYLAGSFVAGFALSFLANYAHVVQQDTIKRVYQAPKGESHKTPPQPFFTA